MEKTSRQASREPTEFAAIEQARSSAAHHFGEFGMYRAAAFHPAHELL
jgi:hypothetical protein